MFTPREIVAKSPPAPPTRTFLTLLNDRDRTVDLWGLARRIEGRFREQGGPESLPERPPQRSLENPERYTWAWLGDQRETLPLCAEWVIEDEQLPVRVTVKLDGIPPVPAPEPEPAPAPEPEPEPEPEPDPVQAFEEARAELAALGEAPPPLPRYRARVRLPGSR